MKTLSPLRSTSRSAARGFTLIELLVVIAIIAILAAILFPVFATAREKARQISCVSNLKQLSLAFTQYQQDYDELGPNATDGKPGEKELGGWMFVNSSSASAPSFDPTKGSIYSYVKSAQVFVCPDDGVGRISGDSYALNGCVNYFDPAKVATKDVVCPDTTLCARSGKSLAAITNPSGTMLLSEEAGAGSAGATLRNSSTDDAYFNPYTNNYGNGGNGISIRHTSGANILYFDGHAKWHADANPVPTGVTMLQLQTGDTNQTDVTKPICPG